MTSRYRLPNRRPHLVTAIEHSGMRFTVGIGSYDDGRLAEVFLNTAKIGTAIDVQAKDSAVLLSLLLQHGCPIETIRGAVLRNPDGSAASPIGAVVDLLGAMS